MVYIYLLFGKACSVTPQAKKVKAMIQFLQNSIPSKFLDVFVFVHHQSALFRGTSRMLIRTKKLNFLYSHCTLWCNRYMTPLNSSLA